MDQSADAVLRPLGGNENGLFRFAYERHGAFRVACCARLHGIPFSRDALQSATASVQQRHPLLHSVVRKDMRFHSSAKSNVQVTVHRRKAPESWQHVLGEEMYSKAAEFDRPLMKVALVARDDQSEQDFELLLAVEHVVCDGISIMWLLDELLTAATQSPSPKLESLRTPPSIEMCLAKQSWPCEPWALFLHLLILLLAQLINLISCCMRPVHVEPLRYRRFAVRTLDVQRTQRLIEAARLEGTTVTGALLATVMVATRLAQNSIEAKPGPVSCLCPIDLRNRYMDPVSNQEMAYHVVIIELSEKIHLPVTNTADVRNLWRLARSTRESLMDKIPGEAFAMSKLVGSGAILISARTKNAPDSAHCGFVTNWGRTPLKKAYGGRQFLEMIPLLRLVPINMRECLAATTNGKLTLAFNIPDVVCGDPENDVELFADFVVTNLENMASVSNAFHNRRIHRYKLD